MRHTPIPPLKDSSLQHTEPGHGLVLDLGECIVYHNCLPIEKNLHELRRARTFETALADTAVYLMADVPTSIDDIANMLVDPDVRHVRYGEDCDSSMDAPCFADAVRYVARERHYQMHKYGWDKEQSLPGFLIVISHLLGTAVTAWTKNRDEPRRTPLAIVTAIAATAIACIQRYGATGSAHATNDKLNDGHFDADALDD